MHNRACFGKPFRSERVNESENLLTSAEMYFYRTFLWFWARLSYKKLLVIRSEILELLDIKLTLNYEYSRSKRENLQFPVQIKSSKKQWTFWSIFFTFLISTGNVQCFEKRNDPHRLSICEVIDSEICAYLNA